MECGSNNRLVLLTSYSNHLLVLFREDQLASLQNFTGKRGQPSQEYAWPPAAGNGEVFKRQVW
jgi:hypothetical protein